MIVDRPIFMIGTGRAGSTVSFDLLARHPDVAWMSSLCNRFPWSPRWNNRMLSAMQIPGLGRVLRRRFFPVEGWEYIEVRAPGFSYAYRDLYEADLTEVSRRRVHKGISRLVTDTRPRFATKLTGWPRIGYLSTIFKDALFIHLVRDGRAFVHSLLNVNFWRGWEGPEKWRWGPLSETNQRIWEANNKSFAALAAIQWNILVDATEEARVLIPESQYLEIRYEDMCDAPIEKIRELLHFCDLPWSSNMEKFVLNKQLKSANKKWLEMMRPEHQKQVNEIVRSNLIRYGYSPDLPSSIRG